MWLSAIGSVRALVGVGGNPALDFHPSLCPCFPSVEISAFILQGSPEPRDEDVNDAAPLFIHRDTCAYPFQPVGPGEGR